MTHETTPIPSQEEYALGYEALNTKLTAMSDPFVSVRGTDYLVEIELLRQQANSLNNIPIEKLTKTMVAISALIDAMSAEQKEEAKITRALDMVKTSQKFLSRADWGQALGSIMGGLVGTILAAGSVLTLATGEPAEVSLGIGAAASLHNAKLFLFNTNKLAERLDKLIGAVEMKITAVTVH